jgi:AraC-like DNA-binding protein
MNYQVYTPHPQLEPFIKCFWSLDSEADEQTVKQRVLPDGCMEMLFNYGDQYLQYLEDGSTMLQPKCFVFGQISKFLEIEPTGITGILSVRFHPDGLAPFIDIPVTQFDNRVCRFDELFGEDGEVLGSEVLQADDHAKRIAVIEKFFLDRLLNRSMIDDTTKSCVDMIFQSEGQLAVTELADSMNITRRNMERKFISLIGLSPKQLARVTRLQATIKMLRENRFTSLTSLAYENGYYDQAHFIKDFKDFTGVSPKAFYADNLQMAMFFAGAE